jgi:hypothetical protein
MFCGDVPAIHSATEIEARIAEEASLERTFLASVIVSAKTVWGEDLLSLVPLLSLRRLDVLKSIFPINRLGPVERRRVPGAARRDKVCDERSQALAAQPLFLLSHEDRSPGRRSCILQRSFGPS